MIFHFDLQVSETGPAHDKTFTCECRFQGYKCQATAKNKKEAKNLAAKEVIAVLDDNLLPHEPTYQSKLEAKMEKKAIKEEMKKEIRNSRLYNEIKGSVGGSNPKNTNFELGEPRIIGTNLTFPIKPEPPTRSNPKITNFEMAELGKSELRIIPKRTLPSRPEPRNLEYQKITNFRLAELGKPELQTILSLAFPEKPETRIRSNPQKGPNFEKSPTMKGFTHPPMSSRSRSPRTSRRRSRSRSPRSAPKRRSRSPSRRRSRSRSPRSAPKRRSRSPSRRRSRSRSPRSAPKRRPSSSRSPSRRRSRSPCPWTSPKRYLFGSHYEARWGHCDRTTQPEPLPPAKPLASRRDPRLNKDTSTVLPQKIFVRKDLFEKLSNPHPEVPIAPPPKAVQIDQNDEFFANMMFEHDITKVKSEIKIEVKNEKE